MFEREDIVQKKSFIGVVGRFLGLIVDGRARILPLASLILISLTALSLVTFLEGRFGYGSVTAPVEGVGTVLGMSFLGDTMVWPFIFLVPLCLVLTLQAVKRTVILLNLLCEKVQSIYQDSQLPDEYNATINEVKNIFRGQIGSATRLFRLAPWAIAAIFWVFNSVTCALNQYEKVPNPYTSKKVVVMVEYSDGQVEKRTEKLEKAIPLPKWDTNLTEAPASTLLTRVWTLLFYSIAPFLLFKLIQMVWGLSYFIRHFKMWIDRTLKEKEEDNQSILVNAFDEDRYGGLSRIAEAGMGYFYTAIGLVSLVLMSFFKEGPDPSWHNYVLMILLVPAALVVFLVPIMQIREIIKSAKVSYLMYIGKRLNRMFEQLDQSIQSGGEDQLEAGFHANLSALKMFHDQVEKMQEWPFSSSTVYRISLVMLAPFSGILIKFVTTLIFGAE